MNAVTVRETLRSLALERPIFHSEADFQHGFAWAVQLKIPEAKIRLEVPLDGVHVDAIVRTEASICALELKYKTRACTLTVGSERFILANHGAHPPNRYLFLKDICRLENLIQKQRVSMGFAVMLTNDPIYWQLGSSKIGSAFLISEGIKIEGSRQWHPTASKGTTKGIEEPLIFRGSYVLKWQIYSHPEHQEFRYVLVEVI